MLVGIFSSGMRYLPLATCHEHEHKSRRRRRRSRAELRRTVQRKQMASPPLSGAQSRAELRRTVQRKQMGQTSETDFVKGTFYD